MFSQVNGVSFQNVTNAAANEIFSSACIQQVSGAAQPVKLAIVRGPAQHKGVRTV